MHELIQAYLQALNRAVLAEEEVARGCHSAARLWLVRAGLACPEVLQRLCGVEDVVGLDVADDRADFSVCSDARVRSKAHEESRKCNHKQQAAVDQRSVHCILLLG